MYLFFSRSLFALGLAVALLIGGCDTFSSSDSSPDWVGDWEITAFAEEPTEDEIYYTFTEENFTIVREPFREGEEGCEIFRNEIENVEDDEVVIKVAGRLQTNRLEVNGKNLTGTIVRSNNQDFEGETYKGVSVNRDPKEIVGDGCQESAAKSLDVHPLR